MSKNPPDLSKIVTPKHKRKMLRAFLKELKRFPTKNVAETLVEFVERKRILVSGTSARPGPYRFSVTPYLREPANCLSDSSKITELVIMKGTQTGGTDGIMMNHELYCIEYGIGPVLYVSSDDGLALEHMEKRVSPMISAAGMQDHIQAPVKRKSNKATGDTARSKSFKGTFLRAIGARSESKLSSLPSRILHLDEEEKYPISLQGGGDSIEKASRRTDSYKTLKKIVHISTPKMKANSKIEPLFEQGDMRYYHYECPGCKTMQKLEWSRIKWDKDKEGKLLLELDENDNLKNNPVWHECKNDDCDYQLRDHEKVTVLQEYGHGGSAEWRASKKPDRPGLRSYHIGGLYGFRSWVEVVIQFQKAKDDPLLLQDFINDFLGETFTQKADKPDEHILMARAENDWKVGERIPDRVKVLTLGCDVQKDRLECVVMGWTNNLESWALNYHVISGTPEEPGDNCWNELEEIIMKDYMREDDYVLRIQTALVDAPYSNASVMNFCQRFPWSERNPWVGVFPSFGKTNQADIVKQHASTIRTPEILIDDQKLKGIIYNYLRRKPPASGHSYPSGYMHFPADYGEDFYKQLTAEDVVEEVDNKGNVKYGIHNLKQRRNEVLDCVKMALGGMYFFYIMYFKAVNERRKRKKQKEIMPDWNLFWNLFSGE